MKRIVGLLLAIVCIFSLCSCSLSKEPISSDDFTVYFEGKDFYVEDITSQYDNEVFNAVIIAMSTKNDYQIEFYDLTSDAYAKNLFSNNKSSIDEELQGNTMANSAEIGNVSKYSKNNSSVYGIISRVGNTVVYSEGPTENMEDVKTVLKDLGF